MMRGSAGGGHRLCGPDRCHQPPSLSTGPTGYILQDRAGVMVTLAGAHFLITSTLESWSRLEENTTKESPYLRILRVHS